MSFDEELNELMKVRREKLKELLQNGIIPYAGKYVRTHLAEEIKENFTVLEGKKVSLAGRIFAKREHGKASFANLRDGSGQIQIYLKFDDVGEKTYQLFERLDLGDIIGIQGKVFRTRRGEITISVEELQLLTKSLRPLPEKWHGLKDVELRYRQRYLDLMVNPEVKEVFKTRNKIIRAFRNYLDDRGFLEVETPMMHVVAGGAAARPFITYHNALNMNLFLRIAPELYLKRLLVGGFEKIYEINRNFRNEGISTKHNPEFTMLELYQAYADYYDMMTLTEELISTVALDVLGSAVINYEGVEINLNPPWKKMTMIEAVKQFTNLDFNAITSAEEVRKAAAPLLLKMQLDEKIPKETLLNSWGSILNLLFEEIVQPALIEPTFIIDYPIEISPLAKKKIENPALTARFELFIYGREIANAFSELNDPVDQNERFLIQAEKRRAGDEEAHMMDEDFIHALEFGMPPAGGLGIGIDRLVMLLTGSSSIRDIILFPLMKPK